MPRCFVRGAAALIAIALSSSCVVLSLDRFYDDKSVVFDEQLLGTWVDADDHVTVTLERAEWRAYRLTYDHPTEKGTLTAYLFDDHGARYLDLAFVHGTDLGSFVVPAHALVRLTTTADGIEVAPLNFDWFNAALRDGTAPAALAAARTERGQVLLAGGREAFLSWLNTPAANYVFGVAGTFKKAAIDQSVNGEIGQSKGHRSIANDASIKRHRSNGSIEIDAPMPMTRLVDAG